MVTFIFLDMTLSVLVFIYTCNVIPILRSCLNF